MPEQIDVDEVAKEAGYRNFISFVFIEYYNPDIKNTLASCGKKLGISPSKFRKALVEKGYKPKQGGNPFPVGRKRDVDIYKIIKSKTSFLFPWCAFYYLYKKLGLTTYEIANFLGISQSLVLKYMELYGIKRGK